MSRGLHAFKESDLTKAIRGARKAGLAVTRFEVDRNGRITIIIAGKAEAEPDANEWDIVTNATPKKSKIHS